MRAAENLRKAFLGYIIRAVRALVAIVFELDSGLFLAAAAAEGTQQSRTSRSTICSTPFFVIKLVGHREQLVGPVPVSARDPFSNSFSSSSHTCMHT